MFRAKVVEKIETHVMLPPPKIVPFVRKCEKYCRAWQDTDDNMAHANRMLAT